MWASALAVAIPALGAAVTSTTAAAVPAVTTTTRTIATGAGPRPVHIVRIVPGRGVRLEAVWLGGGPGRAGTVGGYIRANAGRGAVAGPNGDFFLLARNVPSGNLLIHKGRSFLGGTNRGAAAFGPDGSVDIVPGNVKDADLSQEGVREAISGKPVYVHDGHVGDLTTLDAGLRRCERRPLPRHASASHPRIPRCVARGWARARVARLCQPEHLCARE